MAHKTVPDSENSTLNTVLGLLIIVAYAIGMALAVAGIMLLFAHLGIGPSEFITPYGPPL